MKISVVLPCRNAERTIGEQLAALAGQTWTGTWELVVADNGSNDTTTQIVHRYGGRLPLRLVDAVGSRGAAHARNVGAHEARHGTLVFCDADDVVASDWLAVMARALAAHEVVAARAEMTALNEDWTRVAREEVDGLPRLPFPPHLPFASTYGFGVHRALHESVGGFDESLAALHDVDYSIRLQLAGARLHYEPAAVVHYRNRASLGAIYRQAVAYAQDMACIQRRHGEGSAASAWRWPLRGWPSIARTLPQAHRKAGRAQLAWFVGWQIGRLAGSARYRVLAV